MLLQAEGFVVFASALPDEALATFPAAHVDLAIVDLDLAGHPGLELIDRMRELRPGLPCIACSGSLDDSPAGLRYVQKPFSRGQLVAAVRQALAV